MYDTEDNENFENSLEGDFELDNLGGDEDSFSGAFNPDELPSTDSYEYAGDQLSDDFSQTSYDDGTGQFYDDGSGQTYDDGSGQFYDDGSGQTYDDGGDFASQDELDLMNEPAAYGQPVAPGGGRPKKQGSPLLLILGLGVLLMGGLAGFTYYTTGTFDVMAAVAQLQGGGQKNSGPVETIEDIAVKQEGDEFFNNAVNAGADPNAVPVAAGGEPLVETPQPAPAPQEQPVAVNPNRGELPPDAVRVGDKVAIPVRIGGRSEPFYPLGYRAATVQATNVDYVLAPASTDFTTEETEILNELMTITVNGIMYDKTRPSAIIKSHDVDHLVHKGDVIEDFEIMDITRNEVVVKAGKNTFRATIGQELTTLPQDGIAKRRMDVYNDITTAPGLQALVPTNLKVRNGVEINPVSNINKQFGGAYRQVPRGVVVINGK